MAEPRPTAPRIPSEYGVPSDASGAEHLPWSWAEEQLETSRNYWVCTTCPDGRPQAMPVWSVWLDGELWFSSGRTTQRVRNLGRNPEVVVHLESGDEVVVLDGRAEEVQDAETFARVADIFEAKYDMRPPEDSPLFVVRPPSAYTWTDFQRTATRWVFD
jgi:nitroimidazol reductase NimA-like FMN-containing flavoprotein (pyridoxamine 5'-phosphate oxidase superfamily)